MNAKIMKLVVLGLTGMGMTGCATARAPVNGVFYSDVKGPIMATTAFGGTATGEACATSILGVYASGDASIDAAKKAGGIAQVVAVDQHTSNILGFYAKYCTVVYGKRGGAAKAKAGSDAGSESL